MKSLVFFLVPILGLIFIFGCSESTTGPLGTVSTPEFDIESGTYGHPQVVRISCATEGSVIRYTLDDTTPTSTSSVYSDSLLVSTTKTIKARAFKDKWDPSDMAVLYLVIDPESVVVVIEFDENPLYIPLNTLSTIRARAYDEDHQPVVLPLDFSVSIGTMMYLGYDPEGWNSIVWNPGITAQNATVTAQVGDITAQKYYQVIPDPPAEISLTAFYDDDGDWVPVPAEGLPVNFPGEVIIRATVRDKYGNSVMEDIGIQFTATLGEIEGLGVTDVNGTASVSFSVGSIAGIAEITATTIEPGEGDEYISESLTMTIYEARKL